MPDRYRVVQRPHVVLLSLRPGEQPPSIPIDEFCFQIEDSQSDGDYVGESYALEAEARLACDRLNGK